MVDLDQRISEKETMITSLRFQSRERLQGRRESIRNQIDNLESVINDWHDKALSASQRLAEYNNINGSLDRSKSLYDRLVTSLHDVDVTRNVDQDMVSILEKVSVAEPVKPGLIRFLIPGASAGLVLGLGSLVFMEQIDDRVVSSGNLEARFGQHLLAEIPAEAHEGSLEPLHENDPRHAFSEALRALRSSLLYLPFEGERPKTILISSAAPDEGK